MTVEPEALTPEDALAQVDAELAQGPPVDPPESVEETPPPETPPAEGEGESETAEDSGDVESADEPNPTEEVAEAADDLHPVLQTLPKEMKEGCRAFTKDQQELVSKIRGLYEKDFQHDSQERAEEKRDAQAFRGMLKDKSERESFWAWKRGQEQGKQPEAPAALKRPRVEEFQSAEEYEKALDDYEVKREERTLEKVQERLTAPQRHQREVEDGLWAFRESLGDKVTDEQFVAAAKEFDASIKDDPEAIKGVTVASARLAVRGILHSKFPRAPVVNPKPNPPPRSVKPASVPARGVPPRVPPKERWEAENRQPEPEEAWNAAGRDAAVQGTTRASSPNGAARK